MRETFDAAPDGIHVVTLEAGESYELPDAYAQAKIDEGVAVKAKGGAPENRALAGAPENRALAEHTVAELRTLAKAKDLEVPRRAKHGELVELLEQAEAEASGDD